MEQIELRADRARCGVAASRVREAIAGDERIGCVMEHSGAGLQRRLLTLPLRREIDLRPPRMIAAGQRRGDGSSARLESLFARLCPLGLLPETVVPITSGFPGESAAKQR